MSVTRTAEGRRRSVAWVFYGIVAVLCLVGGFSSPVVFLGAIVTGLYAYYLFRGGSFVIWFF